MCLFLKAIATAGYRHQHRPQVLLLSTLSYVACFFLICCKEMGGNFIERKIMKKVVSRLLFLSILTLYIIAHFTYFK